MIQHNFDNDLPRIPDDQAAILAWEQGTNIWHEELFRRMNTDESRADRCELPALPDTLEEWQKKRPEILQTFKECMYGEMPPAPDKLELRKLSERNDVLDGVDLRATVVKMMSSVIENIIMLNTGGNQHAEEWQWDAIRLQLTDSFGEFADGQLEFDDHEIDRMTVESLTDDLLEVVEEKYKAQEELFGDNIREVERVILLRAVDAKWMDHIDSMEQLRHGINLRAYAQRDPVVEYKFEAMDMFDEMIMNIKEETVKMLFHVVPKSNIERTQVAKPVAENLGGDGTVQKKPVVKGEKIGRNDPCPCGSGKKYKHCCLGKDEA